ncbi:MAG: PIN domain-containing protein [Oscillospiraceae bacterium]|nr:PIN domain-containing protein [Oscillospiraceae bacterium]
MKKKKVYLDNCCFNRPYDDQTQLRIELETKAKLHIQDSIVEKEILLVLSVILEFENNDNPYELRKHVIHNFLMHAVISVGWSDDVVGIAKEISLNGVKTKDATHLACAIYAKCDYFLTTDDRLLKYKDDRIQIINPVEFLMIEGGNE